jgi:acetyltransferase-like isoleucine patch superfamily enzyme
MAVRDEEIQVSGSHDMLDQILQSYPFGQIDLPISPLVNMEPGIAAGATSRVTAARGAKILFHEGVSVRRGACAFSANGQGSSILIGPGAIFEGSSIQVVGKDCMVIVGKGCRLSRLKIVVGGETSAVVIGAGTTWESGTIIAKTGNIVAIGNDCMVSNGVHMRCSDGHAIFDAVTKEAINDPADVLIGHHVWLGNSSRVNKGTTIGSGTVLGQCGIASGVLQPNSVYAGVPAKQIKTGIVWSRTRNFDDIPKEFLL